MSRSSKSHNNSLSLNPPPSTGAPAQEAVGLHKPDPLADARGIAPRKNPRSALPGVEADACGTALRKNPRSALPGVEADARGIAPRKNPRSVGRGGRPRGRRPHRRRSLANLPSLPRLSPDSPDIEGEIALLRSLTNRLLSIRPIDHAQISRYIRLIFQAFAAQTENPQLHSEQHQIDYLIRKNFHDAVKYHNVGFQNILPIRMAKPGDRWWPWRHFIPLEERWDYGLIDPDEPWPPGVKEYFANRHRDFAEEEGDLYYAFDDAYKNYPPLPPDDDAFYDDPSDNSNPPRPPP